MKKNRVVQNTVKRKQKNVQKLKDIIWNIFWMLFSLTSSFVNLDNSKHKMTIVMTCDEHRTLTTSILAPMILDKWQGFKF